MKRFTKTDSQSLTLDDLRMYAQQAKILRDSPVFDWAIEEVYKDLVNAEDSITADAGVDSREANDQRRNFSGMRIALLSLVEKLDEAVFIAEQANNTGDLQYD